MELQKIKSEHKYVTPKNTIKGTKVIRKIIEKKANFFGLLGSHILGRPMTKEDRGRIVIGDEVKNEPTNETFTKVEFDGSYIGDIIEASDGKTWWSITFLPVELAAQTPEQ